MKICCDLGSERLNVFSEDNPFRCDFTNTVRNLKNGYRKDNEIVYATTGDRSENGKYPVDPDKFPKGSWLVTGVFEIERSHYKTEVEYKEALKTFGKVIITTNAFRYTPAWSVVDGYYDKQIEMMIRDTQFWIHGSDYKTSWGCMLIPDGMAMYELYEICKEELKNNGRFPIDVI